ncbi:Uncharacterised protein [Mycobacteroides abscessus]|nr:Uncharacterised protein [Mycobacteroides abscessus]
MRLQINPDQLSRSGFSRMSDLRRTTSAWHVHRAIGSPTRMSVASCAMARAGLSSARSTARTGIQLTNLDGPSVAARAHVTGTTTSSHVTVAQASTPRSSGQAAESSTAANLPTNPIGVDLVFPIRTCQASPGGRVRPNIPSPEPNPTGVFLCPESILSLVFAKLCGRGMFRR